jgi:hypothetical protein
LSRLHSFIHRVEAQRACLDDAARRLADVPGDVVELGLGNGRTYDHLREILPGRTIFVFDREVASHPDCRPEAEHLFLGDFLESLPCAVARLGGRIALIHGDIGSGNAAATAALARAVAPLLPALLVPGGLVVSDQRLEVPGTEALPLPENLPEGRYHMRRFAG